MRAWGRFFGPRAFKFGEGSVFSTPGAVFSTPGAVEVRKAPWRARHPKHHTFVCIECAVENGRLHHAVH